MMLTLLGLATANAQSIAIPPASEEVVVFGDPFARWDDTRWFVETEIGHPLGLDLRTDDNLQVEMAAMRVRAALECNIDGPLGPNRREVFCIIEDVALQAVPLHRYASSGMVEEVVEQLDGKLTGASVQLQVDARGRVVDLDLEGIPARNRRQRDANETLRQIVRRLVAPFHLRVEPDARWEEHNSLLFELPGPTGTSGSSSLVHDVSQQQGQWVVQSAGNGLAIVPLTWSVTAQMRSNLDASDAAPDWAIVRLMPRTTEDLQLDLPSAGWTLESHGVGTVDAELGFVTERVYATIGEPTPSNPVQQPTWQQGRLRLLGATEHPALGPTGPGVRVP